MDVVIGKRKVGYTNVIGKNKWRTINGTNREVKIFEF